MNHHTQNPGKKVDNTSENQFCLLILRKRRTRKNLPGDRKSVQMTSFVQIVKEYERFLLQILYGPEKRMIFYCQKLSE